MSRINPNVSNTTPSNQFYNTQASKQAPTAFRNNPILNPTSSRLPLSFLFYFEPSKNRIVVLVSYWLIM
ncbi:hypothetical protein BofuT4_uP043320.1 [Botrytis cinerea T4]|uniref:Uncharacterized protein n=1 Tax=Botryotinia fuckeliana (strain T4) TaxID=999810 RepID=G2Y231_BOTF4|nr:hypothetical protein BofuT4_uP043320.1 [Botrytis cinerea T4]